MLIKIGDRARFWRRRLRAIGGRLKTKLLQPGREIGIGNRSKSPRIMRLMGSSPMADAARSNLDVWKKLQSENYFEKHPCYKGISDFGGEEAARAINWFLPLRSDMKVAVIGCGYGRETLKLAPLVGHIYGIDVSETILNKAVGYLSERGIKNFTPVLAESFAQTMPSGLDVVFSIVVMQHLTRDLVRNYFVELGKKLTPGGGFVVQFLDEPGVDYGRTDAPEKSGGEPSISWSPWQLVELSRKAGLTLVEIRTQLVTDTALWHWAYYRKEK
jgi:SAM-dependent methyltransferase